MGIRFRVITILWVTGLSLSAGGWTALAADSPIITVDRDALIMRNAAGCRLEFWYGNGKYGLGTFSVNGVPLGAPIEAFLTEDNVYESSNNRFQRIWPGVWHPYWQADRYEILENSPGHGVIRFAGRMGKLDGTVTVVLTAASSAYTLDYDMKPLESIKHPLYAAGPFFPKQMQFVQFPFETPLRPPFEGHWSITPTLSMVPLMFGCENIDGREYYVGVGYQLEQDRYVRGSIEYDAAKTAPFQITCVSPHESRWYGAGEKVRLRMVIATAADQYTCISGYRAVSGYDVSTPIRATLDQAVKGVMDMYRDCTAYVSLPPFKNKAYHHQINPTSGAPPLDGYGAWIQIGVNAQLAYQFYKYWQTHPDAGWARERACNMAGFYTEVQNEDGSIPSLWDPVHRQFRTYRKEINDGGYIYTTCRQAAGAFGLYRLYETRKATEGIDETAWRQAAVKAMAYIADKVEPNGFLGRSYNAKGEYDTGCAPTTELIALDYLYARTGEKKLDDARARLEQWVYNEFAYPNHWRDWSSDMGGWNGQGPPPWDNDALNSLTFATYCVYRHMRTGEQRYIDWARRVVSYNWLVTIPIQYPDFQYVTKGLTREQDHYLTYDVPFRTTLYVDCYPYLSLVTGDRFFMDFYKMLIQTQMAYRFPGQGTGRKRGLQSFDIGLWWDASGAEPRDVIGEQDVNYIVEFCSLFLESVTSPYAYRYVGGPDWGVGLDYDLAFTPAFEQELYPAAASTTVTSASWNPRTHETGVTLTGESGVSGVLKVRWDAARHPLASARIEINGVPVGDIAKLYDAGTQTLALGYMHRQTVVNIMIRTD